MTKKKDIEVHKGRDSRFYVLDFARYMPPQPPDVKDPIKSLYQLLRPEFVAKWKCPLSPDAFSRMGFNDMKTHQAEVREAYDHLLTQTIPKLSEKLDAMKLVPVIYD